MQFLKVDDAVLHFQVIGGPENGPVLVFANALGTDFRIWRDVIVCLVGKFTILTYDTRGHGLSETGEGPVTMERHAEDLAAIMDHLGFKRSIICGLSVGGLIAQQLYADRRDLVSALILCDTGAKVGDADLWNQRIAAVEANGISVLSDDLMPNWFTADFRTSRAEELAGYRTMLERQSARGYIATCAAIRDTDLREKARQIGVPTICIVGEQDGSTPVQTVRELAKSIPGSRFEIIGGSGHLACVEAPERLADIILAFTDGLPKRPVLN
ncbi:3-oxoadipate enol-lactonase [Pelagibacterium halotolerans]|uniref:Beta-ketoadipate enol-lactone hydrolase n=1 Tax=Pelagibacterium halotolerans (strain DSM 22347 / JCM 15775 / CGMCC 1.7692 / B2) TaxID=1082931 RepID=G4RCH3_PELHB|nr:3-oxoadipate enol-lactonase [Pelagibacterium halotolerans]AEQ50645.1 beta-ketoadipate enol-lactone hydrolase [Pelagibacterium halotolerans B2]QJR19419.1 3-oxoadipate enol-lactonase [Pelagibacterium halotolerans]SDZ91965.1 3-oxoadipate enol-lactonase [Pelagibacterium halotolerans]